MAEQMSEREFLSGEIVRGIELSKKLESSLGPSAYYKQIIGPDGRAVYTRDGATILKEIGATTPVEHEIKQLAEAMEDDPGDGTKRAVIFAGKLLEETIYLKNRQWLTAKDIERGYKWGAKRALEELERLAITDKSDSRYKDVIKTSLSTKMDDTEKEYLSDLILRAYKTVGKNGRAPDPASVHVISLPGADLKESALIENGILVGRKRRYKDMPPEITDAKIALIEEGISLKSFDGAKIETRNADDVDAINEKIKAIKAKEIEKVVETLDDVDVIVSQKMIDDEIQRALTKRKKIVMEGVDKPEFERISRATGARIVSKYDSGELKTSLGYAGTVKCERVSGRPEEEEHIFLMGCKNPETVTLLLRGSMIEVAEELLRSYDDASKVLKSVMKDGKFVPSACATEAELATRLREYAETVESEEGWAIEAFANSLSYIPRLVAGNAMDSKTAGTRAEKKLLAEHKRGNKYAGLDIATSKGEVRMLDAIEKGHLEPARITKRYIELATEYVTKKIMTDGVFVKKG